MVDEAGGEKANPDEMLSDEQRAQTENGEGGTSEQPRTVVLKALRQTAADSGFSETSLKYENEASKLGDILFSLNTHDLGHINGRVSEQGAVTFEIGGETTDVSDINPRYVNELIHLRDTISGVSSESGVTVVNSRGEMIELPNSPIERKKQILEDGDQPPKVPLDKQNLDLDAKSGQWYGSPK